MLTTFEPPPFQPQRVALLIRFVLLPLHGIADRFRTGHADRFRKGRHAGAHNTICSHPTTKANSLRSPIPFSPSSRSTNCGLSACETNEPTVRQHRITATIWSTCSRALRCLPFSRPTVNASSCRVSKHPDACLSGS